jgi:hypothetical protein
MFALQTDKRIRYYCRCKSQLIVYLDRDEIFVATCPDFAVENAEHDHVRIESASLKRLECPWCREIYKVSSDLLREIESGAYISCKCGTRLVKNERLDVIEEALRVFGKGRRQPNTPHFTAVILRCANCRCLNRLPNAVPRAKGIYTCGRCKNSLSTSVPALSTFLS